MGKNKGLSLVGIIIIAVIIVLLIVLVPKLNKGNNNNTKTITKTEKSLKEVSKTSAIRLLKPPNVIKKVYPTYPQVARQARVTGLVILECQTNEKGKVESVKVLKGHPSLTEAAVAAAKQWEFEPYKVDGVAKPVKFTLTIRFTFNKEK